MKRPLAYSGLLALVACLGFMLTANDFLAINRPVDADILVVEGWVYVHPAIAEAAEEFRKGQYRLLITVGGPVAGLRGSPERSSSAVLAASKLQDLGVEKRYIIPLSVPELTRHRTYASALTIKEWLKGSHVETKGINVFTIGPHARKSLVLFTRALGTTHAVGVIAGTDEDYDAKRWWLSPRGIYVISRKFLGFLYAITWPLPDDILMGPSNPP